MREGRRIFVDTNVLVYANAEKFPLHQTALRTLAGLSEAGDDPWTSRQVMREYLVTLTRPQTYSKAYPLSAILGDIRYFERNFHIAEDSLVVTARLLELVERFEVHGKQVHDANIVATMLAHGITHLLTHNVRDFERYSSVVSVIPLEG